MNSKYFLLPVFLCMLLSVNTNSPAAPNSDGDFITTVKGLSETLIMRKFGSDAPAVMVVFIHGDVSAGGPANYHFKIAENAANKYSAEKVLSVALVRPGYSDGDGNTSTGNNFNRSDSYTKENIGELGAAIERLRLHYKPKKVIIAGHSGGAACMAVLIGMKPSLAEAAVLVSCPSDLVAWRSGSGKRAWTRSENPVQWVDKIKKSTKVIALTGSKDDNTSPDLAKNYVELLKARGVDANFILISGATHGSAFTATEVMEALQGLIR
jgi:predicted esterase